jgi:hypothetical protein
MSTSMDFFKDPTKDADEWETIRSCIGSSVAMVSQDEFEGLMESAPHLSIPENARCLLSVIKTADELHKQGLPEEK